MNFARRVVAAVAKAAGVLSAVDNRGGWWPLIREPFSGAWQRNKELTQEDLLSSPIVYSCMTLIANDIGKLRARLVVRSDDGIWSETESPAFSPLLRKPNRYQNHIQFKQWWIMSKLRFGNAYVLKERDGRGVVVRLYVLDPARVTPLVSDDGSVYYQLGQDNLSGQQQTSIRVPASEIIHDRMNCLYHPLVGISPLYAAAIAAGLGLRIQNNTATFFANGSTPSGILIAPGAISPENALELKTAWDSGYTGANAGKVAVLGDGMKFEAMRQNASDSQLIEILKWTDERVCSVFHVPQNKVGVGAQQANANVESTGLTYYSDCLHVLIEEFDECMDEGLGLLDKIGGVRMGVELDLDGLLRMDSKTLMETMGLGVEKAILTTDEARRRMNYGPVDGGDTIWRQQQYYSLAALAERDRKNPLSATPAPAPMPSPAPPPTDEGEVDAAAEAAKAVSAAADDFVQRVRAEADQVQRAGAEQLRAVQEQVQTMLKAVRDSSAAALLGMQQQAGELRAAVDAVKALPSAPPPVADDDIPDIDPSDLQKALANAFADVELTSG